ncbi:Homoserine dehydrogenase [Sebaldella termitidis]|jgi:homoserine dehydrogenase|uniref:Homoserine dehydrogenase n=1 Tax=Sebaldella termitidis (strain ATCC 33386 / NCTC 11300) TaxID=526218 RepID=D1ANQ3_SEBTE|nr:homoserine dehydrogenase [Sebaldella termitidis]ACZ09857.1 Homoserine dehydrogenase [Sebaldella termitidis ATCC 33386]SUI25189.1 Homoserine dehydrogenase [Sebaldella termitidis]
MKIGIIGLGTVGEGVLKILALENKNIKLKSGADLEVKYACDLNIDREFSFDFDKAILTQDYKKILSDPEIDIVVELIGGETIAKNIIMEALNNKKHVITANKALVAKYGPEIISAAKDNCSLFLYEAAVGGGIPIITPMIENLIANQITEIRGIMNGTSNYILTKMKEDKLDFEEALHLAAEMGYAEADPSYDVDGIDAGHKIAILSSLAYGGYINFSEVYLQGIRDISLVDIFEAEKLGFSIKLIASSKINEDKLVEISAEPILLKNEKLLSNVNDVYNAIEVTGSYTGKTLFYGKGAGMEPTASAVISDIVKIATDSVINSNFFFDTKSHLETVDTNKLKHEFYIRTSKDFDLEASALELYEEIDNYYIIIAENISRNELDETFANVKEKLIIKII